MLEEVGRLIVSVIGHQLLILEELVDLLPWEGLFFDSAWRGYGNLLVGIYNDFTSRFRRGAVAGASGELDAWISTL